MCKQNHLGANVIRDGTTRGREDSLSGEARCHHRARAPEGMLPLRRHWRSSLPRANCSELSWPFAEVFCISASRSTDNIRSSRFGEKWSCSSLGRSAFFVVPLSHPIKRNCPAKGHDAVQTPGLQSPRPFADWVDCCGYGGCCLGCHRTDLVTLYVLRELGNHLLELLDTSLHVLVRKTQHPHVSTDKRTPMHHVYHIRSASGTGSATMQVCQAGTDEVHVSNVGVTMALVSDTG